jgi:sugar phosphate permease
MIFAGVGYLTWMPTFLHEKFGLSLTNAGFSSMFYHHAAAFVGVLIGGRFSDRLAARRSTVRMEMEFLGLFLGAPFIWLMGVADSFAICCVAMAGFGLFRGIYDSNLFAALFDVIEPRFRSSSVGLMTAFGFLVGMLGPVALGWMKQEHGLTFGFALLSLAYVGGALVVLLAIMRWFRNDHYNEPASNDV